LKAIQLIGSEMNSSNEWKVKNDGGDDQQRRQQHGGGGRGGNKGYHKSNRSSSNSSPNRYRGQPRDNRSSGESGSGGNGGNRQYKPNPNKQKLILSKKRPDTIIWILKLLII